MRQSVTVRLSEEQAVRWSDAAYRNGRRSLPAFLAWAADWTARYFREQAVQEAHRKGDPILTRLEEKRRLGALVDAAWHALDFLPSPSTYPISGAIRDPKGDLRKALESLHEYLDEVQEEYRT